MSSIFISYRREDAEGQAGRLYKDLVAEFGSDSVFMDVAAIQFGQDFRKVIDQSLSSCGAFLSVIGKSWLTAKDASGQRRLDDSDDFVRLETVAALQRDIPVIPVLVQGASAPKSDQLPNDLKELAYRNAIEITHPRWDSDVQLLIKALRPYASKTSPRAGKPDRQTAGTISGEVTPDRNKWSGARSMALIAIILVAIVGAAIYLWPARKIGVPDLRGKALDSAREVLGAEHLVLGTPQEKEDNSATPGTILAQSVGSGEQVPVGTRIDVTVAAAPKTGRRLVNANMAAGSKHALAKKIAVPEYKGGLNANEPASPAPMTNPKDAILESLQLSADRRPLAQKPGLDASGHRYYFTLSINVPKQTLTKISRVHYDLVYEPNPLSLEGGSSPSFSASYEGWGCYNTVVVSLYLSTPETQPLKKTFNMCTVLSP
ncbi:MAG: PASTA domain-containing protein [Bryobacteraceae bacterium]